MHTHHHLYNKRVNLVQTNIDSMFSSVYNEKSGGWVQQSVLCPGLVNSSLWDHGRAEAQRDAPERRTIAAKESERRLFEKMGASVSDMMDEFLDGVAYGKFICDSVPGTAAYDIEFWQDLRRS